MDTETTFFINGSPAAHIQRLDMALRVVNRGGALAGAAQAGKWIRQGVGYTLTGTVEDANADTITFALFREGDWTRPISSVTRPIRGKFQVHFPPMLYEGRATFAALLPAGTWAVLKCLSLMPDDHWHGWRRCR